MAGELNPPPGARGPGNGAANSPPVGPPVPEAGTAERRPRGRRRTAAVAVIVLVVLAHAWVTRAVHEARLGWGAGDAPPARIEVAFVRELTPTAPPTPPAAPPPAARPPAPRTAAAPAKRASMPEAAVDVDAAQAAASTPETVASAPAEEFEVAGAEASATVATSASGAASSAASDVASPTSVADAASAAASTPSSSSAAAYDWLPPSTQLRYDLTGDVNGPVHGSAQVHWVRVGARYQVHIDTRVALVVSRSMSSNGELGPQGLQPHRYDEQTQALLGTPRRTTVRFERDHVLLGNGRAVRRPDGVQDTASQLVQLVWLFNTQPQRLVPGGEVQLSLALPRRVDLWSYDVLPPETVYTNFGPIEAYPVRPRRLPNAANVLTVQSWIAPTLQHLPVKIRIEQDEQVYVELLLERPPLQAVPSPSPAPASSPPPP